MLNNTRIQNTLDTCAILNPMNNFAICDSVFKSGREHFDYTQRS